MQDPEYGSKITHLAQHVRERPNAHPLIVILGSSHTAMGIRPGDLFHSWSGPEEPPLVHNLSLNGGGPVKNILCLKRLGVWGIRPDYVLIEAYPLMLQTEGNDAKRKDRLIDVRFIQLTDMPILVRYYYQPRALCREWGMMQVFPWTSYRGYMLRDLAPSWIPREKRIEGQNLDEWGWEWVDGHINVDAKTYARRVSEAQAAYNISFKAWEIGSVADRAWRELLENCRRKNIIPILLRMPEAGQLRAAYPPPVSAQVKAYYQSLCEEFGATLVDANDWVGDRGFSDGHHLTPTGAQAFTALLEQRVLEPLIRGQATAGTGTARQLARK
jgi:hypothetical protein